jgi:hypothetical protein
MVAYKVVKSKREIIMPNPLHPLKMIQTYREEDLPYTSLWLKDQRGFDSSRKVYDFLPTISTTF